MKIPFFMYYDIEGNPRFKYRNRNPYSIWNQTEKYIRWIQFYTLHPELGWYIKNNESP
jgi:hypothetical protein